MCLESRLCITLASLKIFKVFQTILLRLRLSLIFQLLSLSLKNSSFSACTRAYEELPHVKNKEIPYQISVSITLIKLMGELIVIYLDQR
jgi:hypothetical protein